MGPSGNVRSLLPARKRNEYARGPLILSVFFTMGPVSERCIDNGKDDEAEAPATIHDGSIVRSAFH